MRIGDTKYLNLFLYFQVHISAKGVKIVAPSLKYESRDVALLIPLKEVVRVLVHFGKGLPVIFLYTMKRCGVFISKTLDMDEASGTSYLFTVHHKHITNKA